MAVVSMSYLLEAGVHFGHQTKRWNPKMKEYIYNSRDDIYIIDLQKTVEKMEEAYAALTKIVSEGGNVLYVGTKKQASDVCREEATRGGMYYMTERWLGGTLTNFRTIRRRVKRLEEIEAMEKNGTFEKLPKKEVIGLKKEYDKLNKNLCGIRDMVKLPQALIIVDSIKMVVGNKGHAVAAIGIAKLKTATLMVGLVLTLFYNLPFELIGVRVSDCLLIISSILSVISGFKYYAMARPYIEAK